MRAPLALVGMAVLVATLALVLPFWGAMGVIVAWCLLAAVAVVVDGRPRRPNNVVPFPTAPQMELPEAWRPFARPAGVGLRAERRRVS